MVRYATLRSTDSTAIYIDEYERKDAPGQPSFGLCDWLTLIIIYIIWIFTLPLTCCCSFKIIPQFERLIVYRIGRILPLKGPGLVAVIPGIDKIKRVDMRMRAFKVPPQEIMTIDNGVLKIGADVQYRFVDPILTQSIQDLDHSLRVTGQASLTSLVCREELRYVKNEKHLLQQRLQSHMNQVVSAWGIEIARFEIEHSTILKESGGITPAGGQEEEEHDGAVQIMNLLKSVFSPESDSNVLPGMMMPGMLNSGLPNISVPSTSKMTQHASQSANGNAPALLTPRELFAIAKGVIDDALCQQVGAIYQFNIVDTTSKNVNKTITKWTVNVKDSPGYVMEGEPTISTSPDVIFQLEDVTFQEIFYGQLSPRTAYMNSRLSLSGSTNVAMKLELIINKLKCI